MFTGQKKNQVIAQCGPSLFCYSNDSQEGADKLTGLMSLQYQTFLTWVRCMIFTVQSPLSSPLLLILGNRDCSPKPHLNHNKQIWMIFAKFFTYTSENSFPPILHLWMFSNNHVSCTISWDHFPLSLAGDIPIHRASMIPNGIPAQSGHNTWKKGKNRQLLTLLSCSFTTYIH